MKRIVLAAVAAALCASGAWARGPVYQLVEARTEPGPSADPLEKLIVVGISDDRDVRNRFEDKFVSYLRAQGILAAASHTLVSDLTNPGDRERILEELVREKVDGALTVRVVPLEAEGEDGWAAAWRAWAAAPSGVGDLVRKTVPVQKKKAKRYGVEFALWDIGSPRPLWAARTGTYGLRDLQMGVSDLLQAAITSLRDTPWLRPD